MDGGVGWSRTVLIFNLERGDAGSRQRTLLSVFLIALAVFFMLFGRGINYLTSPAVEVAPSFSQTIQIAFKTLANNVKNLLIGSGQGTFMYDFSLYRSAEALNQGSFWNIRFMSGSSEVAERLATNGLLGWLAYLGLIFSFFFLGARDVLKGGKAAGGDQSSGAEGAEGSLDWTVRLGVFGSWAATAATMFLYPANLTLEFLFWFLAAVLLATSPSVNKREWQLATNRLASVAVSGFLVVALVGGLAMFFLAGQRYWADNRYLQGLTAVNAGQVEAALGKISAAARFNPLVDAYFRDLSQVAVMRLAQEATKEAPTEEQAKQDFNNRIKNLFALAVNAARQATNLAPANVANWMNQGFVYRNFIGLSEGAFDLALKSYEEAKKLEPNNPLIYLETARVYFANAEALQIKGDKKAAEENLSKAEEEIKTAINLKKDFWPAYFQRAVALGNRGELKEAVAKLEEIKPFNKNDASLAFQLGVYYWRLEDIKKAKEEFLRAVQISPSFANARYFLGLIYDKEGDKGKALAEFRTIASYSEENSRQVAEIIANLEKGKSALGEGVKTPPAPSEIPPLKEKDKKNQ